jgi:tRNA-specific 2-thiouridylase
MSRKKKVFVGMSGGVDSSVAALLLKRRGYDVAGVYMRSYNLDGCSDQDARDARRTAETIGISFYVWDFEKMYKENVVDYLVKGYASGITPNPDVVCNRDIKFGAFYKKAMQLGADFVATGHYVRKNKETLLAAKDTTKDQTYFLWTLNREQIQHSLFPVGDYLKTEIRDIARKAKLPVANKKDSQGICFLGKISMRDFLKTKLPDKKGAIITSSGQEIGQHQGLHLYTIGQRHGLDLKEKRKALQEAGSSVTVPHYVIEKDIKTNSLVVVEEKELKLEKKTVRLSELNLLIQPKKELKVFARLRYRQPLNPAIFKIINLKEGLLEFEEAQKFIAPGQSAVFYSEKGELLGGGIIKSVS